MDRERELVSQLAKGDYEAWADLKQLVIQEAIKMLPMINSVVAKKAVGLAQASKEFYERHPDLQDKKELVTKTMQQLEADKPGLSFDELLNETASLASKGSAGIPVNANPPRKLDELDLAVGKL